jgi:hypothetical protein
MADVIADLSQQLNSPANSENLPYVQMRFGSVVAISAIDNTCTITLSGDTATQISGVKAISTFQPAVGDNVCVFKQGTDVVVMGKFQTSTASSFAYITNVVTNVNAPAAGAGFTDLISVPNSVTITKKFAPSNLFIALSITGWADGGSAGFTSGVNISGVGDFITGALNLDIVNTVSGGVTLRTQRVPCVGSVVIAGVPTGSVTVKIRVRNHGANNLHIDTGDFYTLTVQEIL